MFWYMYTLWDDYIRLVSTWSHIVMSVCLCIVWTLEIYCQQISNILYLVINNDHYAVHEVSRTYSSCNWKFVPFDQHLSFYPFPAPGKHHHTLCLTVLDSHVSEITQYLSLCVRVLSLSIMSQVYSHCYKRISFFLKTE